MVAKRTPAGSGAARPARANPANDRTAHFRGRLEREVGGLGWTTVRVPPAITGSWATMRRLRVRAELGGESFRTSLFPNRDGTPGLCLLVNKAMQQAAQASAGDMVEISLRPDLEDRPSALPTDLVAAFAGDRALRRFAESLSESTRREIAKWIGGVKGEEARSRRVQQTAERLLLTMEGERSAPPVLEIIFARSPHARAAWDALTPVQRRGHLMGIFYYQTPEARARRAGKAVDEALSVARHQASRSPRQ